MRNRPIFKKGGDLIKKKIVIFSIIILIFLFPNIRNVFNKIMMPDKILVVGHQVSEYAFEFTKEIKDEEKIAEFENLFEEIDFSTEEWNAEAYADIILQINHKTGIFTHPLRIWIDGDEATALITGLDEDNIGKLSKSQLENLKAIIN